MVVQIGYKNVAHFSKETNLMYKCSILNLNMNIDDALIIEFTILKKKLSLLLILFIFGV